MESIGWQLGAKAKRRTERRQCVNCSQEFDARIFELPDRTLDVDRLCPKCLSDHRLQQEIANHTAELAAECLDQRQRWIAKCGVTGMYLEKTFDNFDAKLQPVAFAAVKAWSGKSMVLFSPGAYGLGKTHLVSALANHLVNTVVPARFDRDCFLVRRVTCPVLMATENELMQRIRSTYNDGAEETEALVIKDLTSHPLLIIDDVGKVRPRDMAFLQYVYFTVINKLYKERRAVILTTNLDIKGLAAHIGPACVDRLEEMCGAKGFVILHGQSYRQRIANGTT